LRLHESYAASWGIDMANVQPAPATLAYTEFLLATAATGGVGVVCAAMTPCMRLYAHIGTTLDADTAGPYRQWVETYADPGFEEVAALLEKLLDRHVDDLAAARVAYRRAMRLELAFFDAALKPGS
ncbi:TenA family protein, partial [Mycolicibacterium elephantis]